MLVSSTIRRVNNYCLVLQPKALHRTYSHGPTIGQVYGSYQKLDKHLSHLRPDLITDLGRLDALQASGELTPNMASIFKKQVEDSNEAKSNDRLALFMSFILRRSGGVLEKSAMVCRSTIDHPNRHKHLLLGNGTC